MVAQKTQFQMIREDLLYLKISMFNKFETIYLNIKGNIIRVQDEEEGIYKVAQKETTDGAIGISKNRKTEIDKDKGKSKSW